MKTIIIIAAALIVYAVIRITEVRMEERRINSVGARSNDNSRHIAKYDISDPESMKAMREDFKGMAD